MNFKEFFPYENPRYGQIEAISKILEKIESDYKYIILDAKTGFGKTAVSRTITDYYSYSMDKKSFILTSTIQLQNQYLQDAYNYNKYNINYKTAKGRSNFLCMNSKKPCNIVNEDYDVICNNKLLKFKNKSNPNIKTCDNGDCRITKFNCGYYLLTKKARENKNYSPEEYICKYFKSKQEAIDSDVALLNYDMKIIDNKFKSKLNFKKRFLSIYDEAHKIEDKILNQVSLSLNEKTLKEDINYTFTTEQLERLFPEDWFNDMGEIINQYLDRINQLKIDYLKEKNKNKKNEILNKQFRLKLHRERIEYTLSLLSKAPSKWCVSTPSLNIKSRLVTFKPLFIYNYIDELLFKSSDIHIFQSGCFIDIDKFLIDLGLNQDDVYIHTVENIFNFERNSPIVIDIAGKMTRKFKNMTKPKTIPKLRNIFKRHSFDKGLIHCRNKEFANYILNSFKSSVFSDRLISYGDVDYDKNLTKDSALEIFKESDVPLIMVSYSMEEGVDLKYDECRFQIFYKAPFPYLGDERINRRKNLDPDWYLVKAIENFQQMYGRGIRAIDDYCINYILDYSFISLYYHPKFPEYMKNSIIENPEYGDLWISSDGLV